MTPRTGRPTDDRKGERFEIRLSETDLAKLEYCKERTGMTRAQIIRQGISELYDRLKSTEQKED